MSTLHSFNKDDPGVLHVIAERMDNLHGDVGEMKAAIKDLASAIIKLALIEERQGQANVAIDKVCKILEVHDERLKVLETAAPLYKQASTWMFSGVWAAAGLLVMYVLKSAGVV